MIRKYYTGSLLFTAICLALGAWLGWSLTGNLIGTLGIVWIVLVLGVLWDPLESTCRHASLSIL